MIGGQKVYLIGPISTGEGTPKVKIQVFRNAKEELETLGYLVETPLTNVAETWQGYMRKGITQMMGCDGVCLLPGWQSSRGASLEKYIANGLGMVAEPLAVWMDKAFIKSQFRKSLEAQYR